MGWLERETSGLVGTSVETGHLSRAKLSQMGASTRRGRSCRLSGGAGRVKRESCVVQKCVRVERGNGKKVPMTRTGSCRCSSQESVFRMTDGRSRHRAGRDVTWSSDVKRAWRSGNRSIGSRVSRCFPSQQKKKTSELDSSFSRQIDLALELETNWLQDGQAGALLLAVVLLVGVGKPLGGVGQTGGWWC
jgi:hypothetical protein